VQGDVVRRDTVPLVQLPFSSEIPQAVPKKVLLAVLVQWRKVPVFDRTAWPVL